jgi:hypothetical protein
MSTPLDKHVNLLRSLSAVHRSERVRNALGSILSHITLLEDYASALRKENEALRKAMSRHETESEMT